MRLKKLTGSHVKEEITVEEVEEWIPSSRLWLFPWLLWTGTHLQVLPAVLGEVQRGTRSTSEICENCSLHTEEGKANWSHQALKASQQQRRTRGTMEISGGVHGITFEVSRTFQQEKIRAKKLLAQAADALLRKESTTLDREVQEELDVLQLNESIP